MTAKKPGAEPRGARLKVQGPRDPDKLTPMEERFCEEYLVDLCITNAAKRAGAKDSPHTKKNAWVLFQRPRVQKRISELIKTRAERTEITADQVLKELWANGHAAREAKDFHASNRAFELCDKHLGMTEKFAVAVTQSPAEAEAELAKLLGVPSEALAAALPRGLVS